MAWIALLRHGVTDWNQRGVIQGRTDTTLCPAGEEKLRQLRPCKALLSAHWATSPLQRAMQTTEILNPGATIEIAKPLVEADWGEFEGVRRDELAARIRHLGLHPARGLDFTPPGGESMRTVQQRLLGWLRGLTMRGNVVAVTHKGVIRSALSAACDWDMTEDFDADGVVPDWSLPQLFQLERGELRLVQLNWAWEKKPAV